MAARLICRTEEELERAIDYVINGQGDEPFEIALN
jgi:hypothetical protein